MRDIKKILCAIDILDSSMQELVADYTCSLAKKFGADVTVLYVAPDLGQYTRYAQEAVALQDLHAEVIENAKKNMQAFIAKSFTDPAIKVQSKIIQGNAPNLIVDFSEENNMDVIVLGTRAKTGVERILLGSVASKVIKTSHVPVFTIAPEK